MPSDKLFKNERETLNPHEEELLFVPSRTLIIGKTNSGKSSAVLQFLTSRNCPFIYPYGRSLFIIHEATGSQVKLQNAVKMLKGKTEKQWDSLVGAMAPNGKLNDQLKEMIDEFVEENDDEDLNSLIIFDDLYTANYRDDYISNLAFKGRHKNVSLMFLTQVAFATKFQKDFLRQCEYIGLFKMSMADVEEVIKRVFGKNERITVLELYKEALEQNKYGFLILAPNQPRKRVRMNDWFNVVMD